MSTSEHAANALPASGEHLVVVVAHPDDESFGCGSLIALAVATGASVTVICATRGEAGERATDPASDHLPLGVVRERELRAAGQVLGVGSIELLDLADSGFDGLLPINALCGVAVDQLAAELESHFDRLAADVILILDGSDGHRDHRHVRSAVEQVIARSRRRLRLVQACISNSLMRRWVAEMGELNPDAAYLELDVDSLGRPEGELTPIDVSSYLDVRQAAIACHRSQHSPFDGLSPDLRHAFLSTDFITVLDEAMV
jgi:N-acetyl-1-D-myo-inositol-2-amino-2-deoxy-alpha-D-glucopyranoside deacetylase